ncbi:MAG: DUF2332 domain-containing protein [Acidimicrobiia bacterium]
MKQTVRTSFVKQVGWCERMGSVLTAELVAAALDDLDRGGPVSDIVAGYEGDAISDALPLRLMGGVHRLVLLGAAPGLARHYPTAGGTPDRATLVEDFLAVVQDNAAYLRDANLIPPQTNEIGRSATLLPGLAWALAGRDLRVRLLEIGSSAGLNLHLDRYVYRTDAWHRDGADDAPRIDVDWTGPAPVIPERIDIADRLGCDRNPLDVADPEARIRLLSFIWPDQVDRFRRLDAAARLVASVGVTVAKADASAWVAARLAEPQPSGTMTVLQHSVMWMYLNQDERAAIESAVADAGATATPERPFAHIRFESSPEQYDAEGHRLTATVWPGGHSEVLAWGHAHGTWVRWVGTTRADGPKSHAADH